MDWHLWVIGGLALLGAEIVLAGSFFLFFFGLGAIVVGALRGIGLGGPVWFDWVLFALVSVGLLIVFRQRLREWLGRGRGADTDSLMGMRGRATEAVPAGGVGRGEFRGTAWQVRNIGRKDLGAGDGCVVRAVEGLTLAVEASDG